MEYLIEISYKPGFFDALGHNILKDIKDMGISGTTKVKTAQLYLINGDLSQNDAILICKELLTDKITQQYNIKIQGTGYRVQGITPKPYPLTPNPCFIVQVWYKKGVTDAVADTVKKGAADLGVKAIDTIKTGQEYTITGKISAEKVREIAEGLLSNKVIQDYIIK